MAPPLSITSLPLAQFRLQRRGDGAVGYWGIGHGLGSIGYMLIGLRGWIPDALSIIAANVLLFLAAARRQAAEVRQLKFTDPSSKGDDRFEQMCIVHMTRLLSHTEVIKGQSKAVFQRQGKHRSRAVVDFV